MARQSVKDVQIPHHGVFITYGRLLLSAYEAKSRASRSDAKGANADAAVAVVMAVASLEAFLNELAEFVAVADANGWHQDVDFASRLHAYAIEHGRLVGGRAREQTKEKFSAAHLLLKGTSPDWGQAPFQELGLLIAVRDDLVHIKPADQFTRGNDGNIQVRAPGRVQELQRRGLSRRREESPHSGWFDLLMTPELAAWAPRTIRHAISAVLEAFPPEDGVPDLISMFGSTMRKFPALLSANGLSE
jgi:hypothetical protein